VATGAGVGADMQLVERAGKHARDFMPMVSPRLILAPSIPQLIELDETAARSDDHQEDENEGPG